MMETSEIVRNFAIGGGVALGALLGLPIIKIVWDAAQTVKALESSVKATQDTLSGFMERVTKILERHDGDIEELKLEHARSEGFTEGRRLGKQRFDDLHPEAHP